MSRGVRMLHGTSSTRLATILEEGLRPAFLTCDESVARYYAEVAVEEEGGDPVVLAVDAPEDALQVDWPSFDEPLSFYRDDWASDESEWHELLEDGGIPSPDDDADWRTSLEVTLCARCACTIPPESIRVVEGVAEPTP